MYHNDILSFWKYDTFSGIYQVLKHIDSIYKFTNNITNGIQCIDDTKVCNKEDSNVIKNSRKEDKNIEIKDDSHEILRDDFSPKNDRDNL